MSEWETEPSAARASNAPAQVSPERKREVPVLAGAALVALLLDLTTKTIAAAELVDRAPIAIVPRVLDLELIRNPGAAFGLAGGATILFTFVALGVVAFILVTARQLRSRGWAVSLGLLLGGALGNLGDRLFRAPGPLRGQVVDWLHLSYWPVFNLADTMIVLGGVIAVILSLRGKRLDGSTIGDPEPAAGPDQAPPSTSDRPDEGAA